MTHLTKIIQLKNGEGTAVPTPYGELIPETQALIIRFPFGGIIWQRPTAVRLQDHTGTQRYPILDVTRLITWGILAATLLITLFLRLLPKRSPKSQPDF